MIDLVLRCTQDGGFSELLAHGHANFGTRGNDIVCAAVSVLARTAESFLKNNVDVTVQAPERGRFTLSVAENHRQDNEQLRFLALFLTEGFIGLQRDYPENLSFRQEIVTS